MEEGLQLGVRLNYLFYFYYDINWPPCQSLDSNFCIRVNSLHAYILVGTISCFLCPQPLSNFVAYIEKLLNNMGMDEY